mmetsp:Transcript_26752/g.45126  ORF Transcript_26752/g.45126 Transcript_26752/m.45126 type:complete len:108 (+) Transcript_26752:900-1223(+)
MKIYELDTIIKDVLLRCVWTVHRAGKPSHSEAKHSNEQNIYSSSNNKNNNPINNNKYKKKNTTDNNTMNDDDAKRKPLLLLRLIASTPACDGCSYLYLGCRYLQIHV